MKVGYASVDITPPPGLEMCGYGYYLGRVANRVHDPLHARALYLQGDDSSCLIISCDLEGLSLELNERIKQNIKESTGMGAERVMVHCTHTHSGPACTKARGCGKMDEGYVSRLPDLLNELAVDAVSNPQNVVSIARGEARAPGIAHNRTYGESGPCDDTVRVLVVRPEEGEPCVLVNFACHPVSGGVTNEITADYPGVTVDTLAQNGYKAIFVTGFCGDINPPNDRGFELIERVGKGVAVAALEAIEGARELSSLNIRGKVAATRVRRQAIGKEELMQNIREARENLEANPSNLSELCRLSWAIDTLDAGECTDIEAPLQVVSVGDVVIAAFPGETFTAFALELRKSLPGKMLISANTTNGVIGYIPTEDEFVNNGYSVLESGRIYTEFLFVPGFGEEMCRDALDLVRTVADN